MENTAASLVVTGYHKSAVAAANVLSLKRQIRSSANLDLAVTVLFLRLQNRMAVLHQQDQVHSDRTDKTNCCCKRHLSSTHSIPSFQSALLQLAKKKKKKRGEGGGGGRGACGSSFDTSWLILPLA